MTTSTYERVKTWNLMCNNQPVDRAVDADSYYLRLTQQADRLQEELDELRLAIKERDLLEILDAGCDLDVVVAGLNFLSDMQYTSALDAVLANNEDKHTLLCGFAEDSRLELEDKTGEPYNVQHVETEFGLVYSVHRDSDNKICKLIDHPKVCLKKFAE